MSNSKSSNRGRLLVISAPSGCGKGTLIRMLMKRVPDLSFVVSHTTRDPRGREIDGREYHFVSEDRFRSMIDEGEFLEWAEVFTNLYGTSRAEVERILESGRDAVLDIDVQGAAQIKKAFGEAIMVFVLPPSFTELERRIRSRGQDKPEAISRRLETAREEVLRYREYDYLIVNDVLKNAFEDLRSVVVAQRRRKDRADGRIEEILHTFKREED